ncbi:Protein of unknown function [Formivibrio citricus]|uniref:DUF3108 domain-containing protein n=1 Tax=Formivibrio citricus TaxID=83765 RepID=A0A1I4WTW1_9NEIS|nr:DUF3108 domain-containing protein [Formivibrio citricus]SFN16419.1 Protein of unknown function [Formivibrio citricus]
MRRCSWLRRSLLGAFLLSLLLHVLGIGGEDIYAWLTRPEFSQAELRQPSRELKAHSLEEDAATAKGGTRPPDTLDVFLRRPAKPVIESRPAPRPTEARKPRKPAAIAASRVVPVVASAVAGKAVVAAASAPVQAPARASQVDSQPVQALERFPRELKMTYIWEFLPVPARMSWKVSQGRYDLRLEGGFLGISRTFVSSGRVGRNGVTPERFVEYRNNKPEPFYQVDFDWQKRIAEVGEPGSRKSEKLAPGDQDIFSAAFHIGLVGSSKPEYRFSMFSGRRKYENVQLKVAGEAKLRLGKKEVDALLLRGAWDDRKVDFWLAPEWHNIPVRITIVLGNELTLDIWANEVIADGKTLLEWEPPVAKSPPRRGGGR